MQVIATFTHGAERRIARRNARKRHRFFRFNDMGTVLQDRCVAHIVLVIVIICRVEIVVGCDAMRLIRPTVQYTRRPDKPRQRRIRHRLSNTTNGRFLFHLATGKQVVELRFVLVVVDAFVQLVAGLHGVDDTFLRAFLTQDVVDMLSGAVHGAER